MMLDDNYWNNDDTVDVYNYEEGRGILSIDARE
jgi:hypothetical protein